MAKRDYSRYQKKVIGDFYRNRDAIETQRLQEIVTEIYLATTAKKQDQLWERAAGLLERVPDLEAEFVARVLAERDVETLAKIAQERFGDE